MIADKYRQKKRRNKKGKMNNMKIIAIEGLPDAGKSTATDVLETYFSSKGLRVESLRFPNYETPVGVLIYKYLKGNLEADEKTFELLHAADKQLAQVHIQELEQDGVDILLIDRYVHTEWAFGAYDNDDSWLKELTRYMRLPDTVMYLDVEPEVSMHRRGRYGDNDDYESDIERLRYTRNEYRCLFEETKDKVDVQVIDANQPQLITKAELLKVAGQLYQRYTGQPVKKDDVLSSITAEEANLIRGWSRFTAYSMGTEEQEPATSGV